ncbi:uncharacterized protein EAF01_010126 [Botrytis porri]|nr:uncharacterized protein EAF01_010126 [Botrytis porri]KAF7894676.1 hypothetical protein EAF01_010126 [Botrytis porri]
MYIFNKANFDQIGVNIVDRQKRTFEETRRRTSVAGNQNINPLITIGQQSGNHIILNGEHHGISKTSFRCELCSSTFTAFSSLKRHNETSKYHLGVLARRSKLSSINYQPSIANFIGTSIKSIETTKSPTFTSYQTIPSSQELESHTLSYHVLPIKFNHPLEDTEVLAGGFLGIGRARIRTTLFPRDDYELFMYQYNQNIHPNPNLQPELQVNNDLNFSIPQVQSFQAFSHPLYFDPIGLGTYIPNGEDSKFQDAGRSESTETLTYNINQFEAHSVEAYYTNNKEARTTSNTHKNEEYLECNLGKCQKTFKKPKLLRAHRKFCQTIGKPHKCSYPGCPRAYKRPADLKAHETSKHTERRAI